MDNKQLYEILKADKYVDAANVLGVFPIDLIPVFVLKFPCCLVINTKPQSHPGEHWVAVFKMEDNVGIYFDSYGSPPYNLPEIRELLEPCEGWTFNETVLHSPWSTVCRQYCLFALLQLARGHSLEYIVKLLNDCGDTYANDASIFNYIQEKYGQEEQSIQRLKIVDFLFLSTQIAAPKK